MRLLISRALRIVNPIKAEIGLLVLAISQLEAADFAPKELPAHAGYIWSAHASAENNEVQVRLTTKEGSNTEIFYVYNLLNGDLLSKTPIDSKQQLLVDQPSQNLFAPHPEKYQDQIHSIESFLADALEEIGIEFKPHPLFKMNSKNDLEFNPIDQSFEEAKAPSLSLETLIQKVRAEIQRTRLSFMPYHSSRMVRSLERFLSRMDFLEPIVSQEPSDGGRIDAFNLYPLITLENAGRDLLNAIQDMVVSSEHPAIWFRNSKASFSCKLTSLMLLTHNHLSEKYFLQAVAIKFGVGESLKVARLINQGYEKEYHFWDRMHSVDLAYEKLYQPTGISFIDRRRLWKINLALLSPVPDEEKPVWLPFAQRYHYLGAFIAALRMDREFKLKRRLIPSATEALGLGYKIATQGLDPNQLELMRLYYRTGARHALLAEKSKAFR